MKVCDGCLKSIPEGTMAGVSSVVVDKKNSSEDPLEYNDLCNSCADTVKTVITETISKLRNTAPQATRDFLNK